MTKKIINRAWLFLVLLALFSCRTEELVNSQIIQQGQSYTNKSLWKEDEVFIKNVKKIYDENAHEKRMQAEYGKIFWNYATTLNTNNESYLMAPILQENEVVAYVEAKRLGNKVFFEFTKNDKKTNDFFKTIIFTDRKKLAPAENPQNNDPNEVSYATQAVTIRVLECKTVTRTFDVGEVAGGGPNQPPMTSSQTYTVCKFVDAMLPVDTCIGEVDEQGNCSGGGGTGGGYVYSPNTEEEELNKDCAKIEQIGKNEKTKNLFKNLDQTKNAVVPGTGKYSEKGYLLTQNADGTITENYFEGNPGETGITLNVPNQIDGFIHSHYLGLLSVFSVSDLASISWLYKNGKIKDTNSFVFGLVTASGTRYILTIDNVSKFESFASGLLNSNNQFTEKDKNIHEQMYVNGFKISPSSNGSLNEQRFMAFLETQNSGLKVLKANDSTFNSWSVLARNSDGTVKSINCN